MVDTEKALKTAKEKSKMPTQAQEWKSLLKTLNLFEIGNEKNGVHSLPKSAINRGALLLTGVINGEYKMKVDRFAISRFHERQYEILDRVPDSGIREQLRSRAKELSNETEFFNPEFYYSEYSGSCISKHAYLFYHTDYGKGRRIPRDYLLRFEAQPAIVLKRTPSDFPQNVDVAILCHELSHADSTLTAAINFAEQNPSPDFVGIENGIENKYTTKGEIRAYKISAAIGKLLGLHEDEIAFFESWTEEYRDIYNQASNLPDLKPLPELFNQE